MYHFQDDGETEWVARVAYQLVKLDYRKHPKAYQLPADGLYALSLSLASSGFNHLSTYLASFAWHCRRHRFTAIGYLLTVIARSRKRRYYQTVGNPWYPHL